MSSMTVGNKLAESDHCRLTLQLMLQAVSKDSPRSTSIPAPPSVTVEQLRYSASKIEQYRDPLQPLLASMSSPFQSYVCLATALQSCIVHAALATFGRPSRQPLKKVNQKWCDAECKCARAALRNHDAGSPEHAASLKCYKQLLRRKRRAWQKTAQQDLCDLASRNPQCFWRAYNRSEQQKSGIPLDQWKSAFETLYRGTASSPSGMPASSANDPVNPPQPPKPTFASDGCLELLAATGPAFDLLKANITQNEASEAKQSCWWWMPWWHQG